MKRFSLDPLPETDHHYALLMEYPLPLGRTFRCRATLLELVELPVGQEHCPSLVAWGKHEREARENLEEKVREWLASSGKSAGNAFPFS